MDNFNELWEKTLEILKPEMPVISLDTWIRPLEFVSLNNNKIILKANNEYQKTIIDTRYIDLIKTAFKYLTNKDYDFSIILSDHAIEKQEENISNMYGYSNTCLNPKYTFDNFVIGNNTRFAHAACLAVAEAPSAAYNPLFIYGGVGLGKTHLMHAIGNFMMERNPNAKVLYVTSERFLNELVNAILENKNDEFRLKYRNIDLLLIDDIQFIAKKERCQEEFFHTFNTLYEQGKQIVLTSDKPPKDINPLEERLKSRFEWGLIADIGPPEYETRLAILRKKAQAEKIVIDDEILAHIALKIDSNIRELEGTLNKIIAEANLTNSPITMQSALKAISHMSSSNLKLITSSVIKETVARYFDITVEDLLKHSREASITQPRQIAMYLCREMANMSYPKISADFGKKDHTTVMHACSKIEKEIKDKVEVRQIVDNIKEMLTTH